MNFTAALGAATIASYLLCSVPALADGGPSAKATPDEGEGVRARVLGLSAENDLPIMIGSAATLLIPEAVSRYSTGAIGGPSCGPLCDRNAVNGFDRPVTRLHSPLADRLSYAPLALGVIAPLIVDGIDVAALHLEDGARVYFTDVGVLAEALFVDGGLNAMVKFAVRRPRPLTYNAAVPSEERTAPDASLSFYSEHTSLAFTAATAYSYLFALRHPRSPWRWVVLGATEAMAAGTAALRVVAGKHFYSDVLVGAAMGAAVGLTVPLLHVLPKGAVAGARGFHVQVMPSPLPNGAGIFITAY